MKRFTLIAATLHVASCASPLALPYSVNISKSGAIELRNFGDKVTKSLLLTSEGITISALPESGPGHYCTLTAKHMGLTFSIDDGVDAHTAATCDGVRIEVTDYERLMHYSFSAKIRYRAGKLFIVLDNNEETELKVQGQPIGK